MKYTNVYSKNSSPVLYHLLAFFVAAVWGVSFVSTSKLLDAGIQPTEIYIIRFVIAYLVILALTFRKITSDSLKDEVLFMICGLCGGSIYYIGENTALQYTLVTNVSLLVTLSPIITVLLTKMMYKTEQLSKGFIVGSIIAFIGVACVIFNSSFNIEVKPLGDLLSIFAAVSFAIYCIVVKKLNARYDTLFISRKIFFYGVVTALPFLTFQDHFMDFAILKEPVVWMHILFLGVVCSMLAFILWNEAINKLGASRASNYLYFSPLITLIASVWLLNENVSIVGYIGCALTIGGVIVSEKVKFK
jgi:drug/metabolite transporter (DMT)-like permease